MPKITFLYLQNIQTLAKYTKNKHLKAIIYLRIALKYKKLTEYQQALKALKRSLSLVIEAENNIVEIIILNYLGEIYDSLGEIREALSHYHQALKLVRALPSNQKTYLLEATILQQLGTIYKARGQTELALTYLKPCLILSRQIKDWELQFSILLNLTDVYNTLNYSHEALSAYREAFQLAETWLAESEHKLPYLVIN